MGAVTLRAVENLLMDQLSGHICEEYESSRLAGRRFFQDQPGRLVPQSAGSGSTFP